MASSNDEGFFRGSELTRLMVFAAVLVVGIPAVLAFVQTKTAPKPPVETLEQIKPLPPRDNNPIFQQVEDREKLRTGETPAYRYLLEKARSKSPEELAKEASRDISFSDIWNRPDRFRGIPIRVQGTAEFVGVSQEVEFARDKILYEVWVRTADSNPNHFCCVFETHPPKFPKGPIINENVRFEGYFFKILAYQARDRDRGVPLLVGHLTWNPQGIETVPGPVSYSYWIMFGLIGGLLVYSIVRFAFQFKKFTNVVSNMPQLDKTAKHQTDEISPQELAAWVNREAKSSETLAEDSEQ